MREFDIKKAVKELPETPGVYLMHNETDEVIYVGKAVSLKARVSQYFHRNENRQNRIRQMIASIRWFEVIPVESELEALILESNLIKEYRPRYNSALRDDENHPYLRIDQAEEFPVITVTTDNKRDDAFYIGPYYKSMQIESALSFFNKYFGLRSCSRRPVKTGKSAHPCIYLSLGQCMGPCSGNADTSHYRENMDRVIRFFLTGRDNDLRKELEEKMRISSENLNFEDAGRYRNMIDEFDEICDRLDFSKKDSDSNTDLFAIASNEKEAVILLYLIRNRRLSGRDLFRIDRTGKESCSESWILKEFTERFYRGNPYIPGTIILTEQIAGKKEFEGLLSEKKGQQVVCRCPRSGENGRFVRMTKEHAEKILRQKQK